MNSEVPLRLAGGRRVLDSPTNVITHHHRSLNSILSSRQRERIPKSAVTEVDLAIGGVTGEHADQV